MLLKFFHHGVGEADSAVRYLTSKRPLQYLAGARDAQGVIREPAPAVVRGDAQLTRRLINNLRGKKHRYISGVLSFRELISPDVEQRIVDRFEAAAFAGLQPGQFDCLWIRHAHNKRTELHFLMPRCELSTGKALNIRPPGRRSEELFDTFRKLINRDFQLKDPDPSVARLAEAEVGALRDRLGRLTASRAKYNRARFPAPTVGIPSAFLDPHFHEDRTRLASGGAWPPGTRAHDTEQGVGRPFEQLGRAVGAVGAAACQCEHAARRIDSALASLRTRRAAPVIARTSLLQRHGLPGEATLEISDIEGDELELTRDLQQ